MADNAAIYSNLLTNQQAIWGATDRTIDYQYDANGAMTRKLTYTTNEQYPETNFIEKEVYSYNLQGRLEQVTFTDASGTTTTVYTYNADGIRIRKDVDSGDEVTTYLIDPANHTGYAQVIEEVITDTTGATDVVDRISYVVGDDVIAQAVSTDITGTPTWGTAEYLLYDGHGSTRQLQKADETILEVYAYDAYGVNLDASTSSLTSLQYAGEHYDADAGHYYNRARWYNPSNGRFNRVDPFSGNNADPQSLHKYLYAHANPVNMVDPSGLFSIIKVVIVLVVIAIIAIGLLYNKHAQLEKERMAAELAIKNAEIYVDNALSVLERYDLSARTVYTRWFGRDRIRYRNEVKKNFEWIKELFSGSISWEADRKTPYTAYVRPFDGKILIFFGNLFWDYRVLSAGVKKIIF